MLTKLRNLKQFSLENGRKKVKVFSRTMHKNKDKNHTRQEGKRQ